MFDDVNDSLSAWEDIFSQAIDQHAPIMHKRVRKVKQPRWLTRHFTSAVKKRHLTEKSQGI